jgi:hypothetical protein
MNGNLAAVQALVQAGADVRVTDGVSGQCWLARLDTG